MRAAALLVLLTTGAAAETDAEIKAIGERYDECFYTSAADKVKSGSDVNLAAEHAFGACTTENARMVHLMQQNGFTAAQIDTVLLDKKSSLKQEFRKMFLEAAGIKYPK